MKRRDFIALTGTGMVSSALNAYPVINPFSKDSIKWKKSSDSKLFHQVNCDGSPLVGSQQLGLLNAVVSVGEKKSSGDGLTLNPGNNEGKVGGLQLKLNHVLKASQLGTGKDVLEGTLSVKNVTGKSVVANIDFTSSAQPSENVAGQEIYIPISATALNRDSRHADLGSKVFFQECAQPVGRNDFSCHYLEPLASSPGERQTKALLLAPVIDILNNASSWKVALFTPSDQPYRFATIRDKENKTGWKAGRTIELAANQEVNLSCYLLCHKGTPDKAWEAFHYLAHDDEFGLVDWLSQVKVHYYDFLSSAHGKNGLRGGGYEADIPHFKDFHVGLATQHGYYPYIGDFMNPNRKEWLAMQGDARGAARMSISKMKDRIAATRKAGARAGVYMHTVLFDEASPLFDSLNDSILIDQSGQKKKFTWKGPDTVKQNWWMSFASADWTNHLLKQAEYIMEMLDPDAIVFDETFVCLGYDYHPERGGPLSANSIDFFKKMRRLVHSYGRDKALLTSDCGGSNMVMWADGDAGDHSYPALLGNPLYRKKPIRYKAAIGQKPWVPCSWHFLKMWEEQMDLARKMGTGIGLSNGWIEFNGLHGLDAETSNRLIADIKGLY